MADDHLVGILQDAQRRGFIGAGDLSAAVAHARGFAAAATTEPSRAADLGSGGGIPGLVLALDWPQSRWSLIESADRRCAFLSSAIHSLALADRVSVVHARAESVGRDPAHRNAYDLVVARGFGPPAVTAECAAPLLRVGGAVIVSEPPGGNPNRWPTGALAALGLRPEASVSAGATYQRIAQVEACPDRYPRRPGIPSKRPLF